MPSHQINIKEEIYQRLRSLAGDDKSLSNEIEELLNRNASTPKEEFMDKISEAEAVLLLKFSYQEDQRKKISWLFSNFKTVIGKAILNPALYEIIGDALSDFIESLQTTLIPTSPVPIDKDIQKIMAEHISETAPEDEEKKN